MNKAAVPFALSLFLLLAPGWSPVRAGCQKVPPPERGSPQKMPDINGEWLSGEGRVRIDMLPLSGHVDAYFVGRDGKCPFGDPRGMMLTGDFDGHVLKGQMSHCTHVKRLINECKMDPVFRTEFYTMSVTEHDIDACYKTEHYKSTVEYAQSGCHLDRDPSGDGWIEFHLTKASIDCPDVGEIRHFQQRAARAQGVMAFAAKVTSDARTRDVLSRGQKLLGAGANGLAVAAQLGKACTQIRDSANDLRRFLDAVEEVNAASCGQNLARAFDHLFAAAGTLGQRLPDVEGVGTAFTLMAADRTFFQDVSHALNPEERWNAQFSEIEGYTMTCP